MTILIVLGLIAITLALSYAMMRSQTTSVLIQMNAGRREDARQAAVAGTNIALGKMHRSDWAGVDTNLAGDLGDFSSYEVTFAVGDASLAPGDPDYEEYPYRVTLTSTGYCADPSNPSVRAMHRIRVVVRLVTRQLTDAPPEWDTIQQYTVYQGNDVEFRVELPHHVVGPVRAQRDLKLTNEAPVGTQRNMKRLLFVVSDPLKLTAQDVLKKEEIENWGYSVTPIGADGSQTAFRSEAKGHDVAYITEEIFSSDLGTKLKDTYIGIVSEEPALTDEFGIASNTGRTDRTTLTIVDDGHYITSGFSTGSPTLFSSLQHATYIQGTKAPGLRVLGRWSGYDSLIVFEGGAVLTDDASAAGRRVQLPWGGDSFQFNSLTADGKLLMRRAVEWASLNDPRSQYLKDLNRMRLAGQRDDRPLVDSVHLDEQQNAAALGRLELLDAPSVDMLKTPLSSDWVIPPSVASYQLYPGGPIYDVSEFGPIVENAEFAPDPLTNPLGIYYYNGNVDVRSNVTFRGSLICGGNIALTGQNVHFESVDLPVLHASSEPIRLPVVICKKFIVGGQCSGSLTGFVAAREEFVRRRRLGETTSFDITGRILARKEVRLKAPQIWRDAPWNVYLTSFLSQYPAIEYFPLWAATQGFDPAPSLTIQPDPGAIAYHWHNWNEPVFLPHPNDAGLQWDVIAWVDDP